MGVFRGLSGVAEFGPLRVQLKLKDCVENVLQAWLRCDLA